MGDRYTTLPPHDAYTGLTRLKLSDTRSIVCVGTGPAVEEAIEAKAAALGKLEEVR